MEIKFPTKLLKSLIRNNTLKKKDFINEKLNISLQEWYSAPLAVTSNSERDHLMFSRAKLWVKNHGVPIVSWKIQCTGAIMNYLKDSYTETEIFHEQSGQLSFFVQGAMSYITENINPKKGLANGTTVYMHSLTFSEEDMLTKDYQIFSNEIKHSLPGEHIHIKKIIPKYINVETQKILNPFGRKTRPLERINSLFP